MADAHIRLHIDLGGLPTRMQKALKSAMHFVAIGLNASPSITEGSFAIPDTTMQHEFDANNPWTPEQAKVGWNIWILRNGFRDAAEAISGILEEVQAVLSYWRVDELQIEKGQVLGEDWNEIVVQRGQQFHRRTLPQRVEFLEKHYGFLLDAALFEQINTFNIARNCLAHREGAVSELDVNTEGKLGLKWSALVTLVIEEGGEVEIQPPHFVEAGTTVAVAVRPKGKTFAVGEQLQITALEFAQICWTCFLFAQSCATRLEEYGKQRGRQFGTRAL